ncbi:MAG: TlpA family protein disulfide reductase [Planctomycetes bacterium]|nr:TlpA family protein disulfide reductase [Planctomycetota bacterium]
MIRRLAAGVFASLAFCGCGGQAEQRGAATIEMVDLHKLEGVLASHRGHAVLLNLWATWCGPCVDELPDLIEVARAYRERGAVVLLLSYDLQIPEANAQAIVPRVKRFIDNKGFDVPVLVYDAPNPDAINERFDLPGHIPVTLAFDKDGRLVDREDGEAGKERFEELMKHALGI